MGRWRRKGELGQMKMGGAYLTWWVTNATLSVRPECGF
jgi:hypothetical protein